jgi:hypothetical protein
MPRRAFPLVSSLVVAALYLASGRVIAQDGTVVVASDKLSPTVDHPLVPLATISTKLFIGEEVDEETGERIATRVEETVVPHPAEVAGITTTVVTVDDYHNGELHDVTADYFAQGVDGTVYSVGERDDEYENGTIVKIINHADAWLTGDHGNQPGVFMPADPAVGATFFPEHVPDVAIEQSTVIAVEQSIITAAGTFEGCVVTKDIDLPQGTSEEKAYCPQVGLVREDFPGGHLELVQVATTS